MGDLSSNKSVITFNVNGLNVSGKRQKLTESIKKKNDPTICCL